MENASKALIIAASVLLAILIVSLGVRIFNKAQSSYDDTDLDSSEITMFNSKFERYDNKRLGSQVKSLISYCISNANTNSEEPSKLPTVTMVDCTDATGSSTASDNIQTYVNALSAMRSKVVSTKYYNVTISYGQTGLVNKIDITLST